MAIQIKNNTNNFNENQDMALLCQESYVDSFKALMRSDFTPEEISQSTNVLKSGNEYEAGGIEVRLDNSELLVIRLIGYIFPCNNIYTALGFGFSMEALSEIVTKNQNRKIDMIFDSPGGDARGVPETADLIYESRNSILSFAMGNCTSAAYWLASACGEFSASKSSTLGSVGVVMTIVDFSEMYKKVGIETLDIVSGVSPLKRGGLKDRPYVEMLQQNIDDLGQILIESVAKNRGVETQFAAENFGKGGIMGGERALKSKMIDKIETFSLVSEKKELTGGTDKYNSNMISKVVTAEADQNLKLKLEQEVNSLEARKSELAAEIKKSEKVNSLLKFCSSEEERKIVNSSNDEPFEAACFLLELKRQKSDLLKKSSESQDIAVEASEVSDEHAQANEQKRWFNLLVQTSLKRKRGENSHGRINK